MNNKVSSLSAVIGAAFMASATLAPMASAADATFAATSLESGYTLAEHAEGKCGEAKCGADKKAEGEGKCGEGKCGEGKCGADKKAKGEGKCGEGKCGEGKCGADKKAEGEGKCGEGKCGGDKKAE